MSAATLIMFSAAPALAGEHSVANGTSIIMASEGGGDGGSDRRAIEQADYDQSYGPVVQQAEGNGGSDRRAIEQADNGRSYGPVIQQAEGDGGSDRRAIEQA